MSNLSGVFNQTNLNQKSSAIDGLRQDSSNIQKTGSEGLFGEVLAQEMSKVFGQAQEVNDAVESFNRQDETSSIEKTAFLMAQSETDLKVAVQVRNKVVSAYQEIMNLQL